MFHFYLSDFSSPIFPYESVLIYRTHGKETQHSDIQWGYLLPLNIASFLASYKTTVLKKNPQKTHQEKTFAACYQEQI